MATEAEKREAHNTQAVGYMLLFVAIFSLVPLMIDIGGGTENPFLMNAVWRLGGVAGGLSYLLVRYHAQIFNSSNFRNIVRQSLGWTMLFASFGKFEFVWYALSTRFIDISAAAVLYETWPMLMVFVMAWLFRNENRYRSITTGTALLIVLCFLGYVFVIASQIQEFDGLGSTQGLELMAGVGLVTFAAVIGGTHNAVIFRWGIKLGESTFYSGKGISAESSELLGILLGQMISQLFCLFPSFALGFATGESLSRQTIIPAITAGILVSGISDIVFRKANSLTDNLGINAISYSTPIVGLAWLVVFGRIGDVSIDLLVIGAAAVISANLLINFEAEIRFGFKALILALWGCGAFVYLRDEFLIYLPFGGWLWPRETYLGALGFSATVFILLLTFRVARLAPRTQDEDNRIFALHRNLELLARRGLIAPEASEHVRAIDGSRNVEELRRAYTRAKLCFVQAAAVDLPLADRRLLNNAETQLNMMVHSRQQGVDFGELFALIIFGGSTVLLSLLSRPEVSGWTAFLYEVFSALFPAVIIFLIVNVWDLHRDRANLVLATQEGPEGYGVIFRDPKSRRFEQGVSVVIGWLIIAAYAVLLWYKWIS